MRLWTAESGFESLRPSQPPFESVHIVRNGRLSLPIPPAEALTYFSAEGERRWVTGWEPEPLHAPGGDLAVPGAVLEITWDSSIVRLAPLSKIIFPLV